MKFSNCSLCNKPYIKKIKDICPDCILKENDLLQLVKEYLRKHPLATLSEVEEGTEVSKKHINRFIREGRLDITVRCKKCGIKIKSKDNNQFCITCKEVVRKNLMTSSERIAMEREVTENKIKELKQRKINDGVYGLGGTKNKIMDVK